MRVLILILLFSSLFSKEIDTFYGKLDVEEAVLLELIDHPAFQRLHSIHQYGIAYYTTHPEEYSRYDHSLGVFAILRIKGASLEEQIAGLLHDVSHTAFSHVGDWVFGKENQEKDYQNSIHAEFIKSSGVEEVLNKYGMRVEEIIPTQHDFPALECPLPDLCADRIDYNIQGAFYRGFITHEEALSIIQVLKFVEKKWVGTNLKLLKKLAHFSLEMTQSCWGGACNYLSSMWFAEAILRAVELGDLSLHDFQFGKDDMIWNLLQNHTDRIIKKKMSMLIRPHLHYSVVSRVNANLIVKSKFRGIDPWVVVDGKLTRLTLLDPDLAKDYVSVKGRLEQGEPLKIYEEIL